MIDPQGAIIGCLLVGNNEGEIIGQLEPNVFTNPDYADLYSRILKVYNNTGKIDPMCVMVYPENLKQAALYCADTLPALSNWQMYIELAKAYLAKTKAESIGWQIASGKLEIEEIQELSQQLIKIVNFSENHNLSMDITEGLRNFVERKQSKPKYIKTGFSKLDKYAQISKGDVVVIGARPSGGKTALSLQIAYNIAKQGYTVVFFSLETSKEKIYDRIITAVANLNFWNVKHHEMETEWENLEGLTDDFSELNLTVVNASGKSIKWMQAESVRLKADVAFVDYLQIVHYPGSSSRYEKVTQISADIHVQWAQGTETAVIALSQLRRNDNRKPTLEDLRESGQIEQDADIIMLLDYDKEKPEYFVNIAKNKDGETGEIEMKFDGLHQRHYEVDNGR